MCSYGICKDLFLFWSLGLCASIYAITMLFWLIESVVHFEIKYYDVNLVFVNLKLSTMMANWS